MVICTLCWLLATDMFGVAPPGMMLEQFVVQLVMLAHRARKVFKALLEQLDLLVL